MTMEPSELGRAMALLEHLLALPAERRAAAMDSACDGDPGLRKEVAALLAHHDAPVPDILRTTDAGMASAALSLAAISEAPSIPETIGPYRIDGLLGRGGMGVVYRASQDSPSRSVALKVMQHGMSKSAVQRFGREVELLGRLQHPGIAQVYAAGTCDLGYGGVPYFAMQLVDGAPITEFARDRKLSVAARCDLLATVCDAVQHANENGVLHRDLKPSNILVAEPNPGSLQPVVLDFGIARTIESGDSPRTLQTRSGELLGTLPYMSPELLTFGSSRASRSSDVYALGVILYELLSGNLPLDFAGLSLTDVGRVASDRMPVPLGRVDPALRGELDVVANCALAKDVDRRYPSAGALAEDLRRVLRHEPIQARPLTTIYQLRKFARRNRALVGGVIATFLVLITGLVVVSILAANNRRLAEEEATARGAAESTAAELRTNLYAVNMRLAGDAIDNSCGFDRVRETLAAWDSSNSGSPGNSIDGALRGWEWDFLSSLVATGQVLAGETFEGLVFRPDGKLVLVDRTSLEVREAEHLDRAGERREFEFGRSEFFRMMAADYRGDLVALWFADQKVALVDTTELSIATTVAFNAPVARVGRPFGGKFVVVVLDDDPAPGMGGTLQVVDATTGHVVRRLGGLGDEALQVAEPSPGGGLLAATRMGSGDVIVWDTTDWHVVSTIRGVGAPAHVLAWHPSGRRLAVGFRSGQVWILDPATSEVIAETDFRGHAHAAMDWSEDGKWLATSGLGRTLYLWCPDTGARRLVGAHPTNVRSVVFAPGGDTLLSSSAGVIRSWDLRVPAPWHEFRCAEPEERGFPHVAWSPDGAELAIGTNVVGTRILDPVTGTELRRRDGYDFVWNRDGRLAASAAQGQVHVWQRDEALPLITFDDKYDANFGELSWSPTEDLLAITDNIGKQVLLWNARTAAPRKAHRGGNYCLSWSPDGTELSAVAPGGTWSRFDRDLQLLQSQRGESVGGKAAWSPDGSRFAIGLSKGHLVIRGQDGQVLRTIPAHTVHIGGVAWSPDGRRIATGSYDGSVRLWDAASGLEMLHMEFGDAVISVAWSPDGHKIAVLQRDAAVRILDASIAAKSR